MVEIANFLYISLVSPNSKEKHTKVNISLFLVQVLVAFANMQLKHITKRNHTKAKKTLISQPFKPLMSFPINKKETRLSLGPLPHPLYIQVSVSDRKGW